MTLKLKSYPNPSIQSANLTKADFVKNQVDLNICATISIPSYGTDEEVLNQCIQDNTFENPIFKSNELNGRSNHKIKKTITTYHYEGNRLVLPRGYTRNLLNICRSKNITPQITDSRASQPCQYPEKLKGIVLRPYQQRAIDSAMKLDQGVIVSPTGSGKSFIALEILRLRQQKALIIVHRFDLAKQWITIIRERLGIKASLIGDGKWEIGSKITVGMIQTLSSKAEETKKLSEQFGLIFVDESHHLPCHSCFTVMNLLNAKYKYGISATLHRRDGLEQVIYRCIGPAIAIISRAEVESIGATVPAKVIALKTEFSPSVDSWHDYLTDLAVNADRNILIINLATSQAIPVLILCDRAAHAEHLSEMLSRRKFKHVLAHGQVQNRDEIMEKVKTTPITIATTSLIGEGIDVSSWSVLIMASPISSETKLLQAIGRIVRKHSSSKEKALVYDLRDDCGFAGASFNKRFEIYKKHRIWVEFNRNEKAALNSGAQ